MVGLAKYFGLHNGIEGFNWPILLQEYIIFPTLRDYIENYGLLGEEEICVVTQKLLLLLKKLRDKNMYHGWLSVNNVHISAGMDIIITDYGLMNALWPSEALNINDCVRLDIFCMGIMILKMMGKLRLYRCNDIDFYLENIHNLR